MTAPRLTFSTGSLYLYSLDRCFALAADYGFDGLEVLRDERLDTRQPDNLRRLMEAHGLPILSLHAPFASKLMPGLESGVVDSVRQTVALAEALSAEHVVMHLPDRIGKLVIQHGTRTVWLPWRPLTRAIQRWMADGGLAHWQAETPVKICVENMPIKSSRLKRLFPRLDQQRLTWWNTLAAWPQTHDYLTLDTTHWATHGIDPITAYRAGNGRVRHVHLSNFRDGVEHQLPHLGELDLAGFLHHLVANGFDGHIVVELNPQSLEAADEAKLRQHLAAAVAFCREALDWAVSRSSAKPHTHIHPVISAAACAGCLAVRRAGEPRT